MVSSSPSDVATCCAIVAAAAIAVLRLLRRGTPCAGRVDSVSVLAGRDQRGLHSLEAGLQIVAQQTVGFYARTRVFPARAMRQLGYYVLFIDKPDSDRRIQDLEVLLTRPKGRVLATSTYLEHD